MIYLFDVDGTLTPSRGVMDAGFQAWFLDFANKNTVGLATGSDRAKTVEQVGEDVFSAVTYSFNCLGNETYHHGELIYKSDWQLPDDVRIFLEKKLAESSYQERYGNHIEQRTGLANFSVVGRNAVGDQRKRYYLWDREHSEREKIANEINETFDGISSQIGGETGIDIFPQGKDKAQVLEYFDFKEGDEFCFIGDRQDPAGNDYTLSKRIIDSWLGRCYNVNDWKGTWNILKTISRG